MSNELPSRTETEKYIVQVKYRQGGPFRYDSEFLTRAESEECVKYLMRDSKDPDFETRIIKVTTVKTSEVVFP